MMKWCLLFIFLVVTVKGYVIKGNQISRGEQRLHLIINSTRDVNIPSRDKNSQTKNMIDVISKPVRLTNVVQLNNMIKCMTGRSGLAYNNYGCYCGLGGQGTPVDEVDKCCQVHDNCYEEVERNGCTWLNKPHLVVYKYKCANSQTTCFDQADSCDRRTCDCDREFSMCLSKVKYNKKYKNFPKRKC